MTNETDTTDTSLTDAELLTALHHDWVHEWDRERGAGHWDLREAMEPYYRWDSAVLLYDDMDPEHRTARTPTEYQSIWEPVFNGLAFADHCLPEGPYVEVGGDLASTWVVFVAILEPLEGETIHLRSTNVLTWRRREEGWRIVRDHTSSVHISQEEADAAFAATADHR